MNMNHKLVGNNTQNVHQEYIGAIKRHVWVYYGDCRERSVISNEAGSGRTRIELDLVGDSVKCC